MNRRPLNGFAYACVAGVVALAPAGRAQLFENLERLSGRIAVGGANQVGAKGLAAGDFDGDGKDDWAVSRMDGSLLIAWGRGDGSFEPVQELKTPGGSLRQLIAADLNGDTRPDLAVADPYRGKVFAFLNAGHRTWEAPTVFKAWEGVRNLVAMKWRNSSQAADLIAGGPDKDVTRNFDEPWKAPPEPLPPQGRHGVALYAGENNGQFALAATYPELSVLSEPDDDEDRSFPRPVYVLKAWRPPGVGRDVLIATTAVDRKIWFLEAAPIGDGFSPLPFTPLETPLSGSPGIRAMAVGALSWPASDGRQNLVVASLDDGKVLIYRLTYPTAGQPAVPIAALEEQLGVPGGPRALEIADLDGDGWNELIVLGRKTDRVLVFKRRDGALRLESQAETGRSPREMAVADFNGDGRKDLVVLNRLSLDVSVLLAVGQNVAGQPTGFSALDQTFPVHGDVAQLIVRDLNGDGRDDIMLLHRSSAEVSVWIAGANGRLETPELYTMVDKIGAAPNQLGVADINNDGRLDLISVYLGDRTGGGLGVRLGVNSLPGTRLGPLQEFRPPLNPFVPATSQTVDSDPTLPSGVTLPSAYGGLLSLLTSDLDGDKRMDLAVSYRDDRVVFFKGDGRGQFVPTSNFAERESEFVGTHEVRRMAVGDFDDDQDMDVALLGYKGDVVILENTGNFFFQDADRSAPPFRRHVIPAASPRSAGANDLVVDDIDRDGDEDLLIGTGDGVWLLRGRAGVEFDASRLIPGGGFAVRAMAMGDFDGVGDATDVAAVCRDDGCLNLFRWTGTDYEKVKVVGIPPTTFLAAGDVDGDGMADLVGCGSVVWVALSSKASSTGGPLVSGVTRARLPQVVINEIQPQNNKWSVVDPGNPAKSKTWEYVELFNGSDAEVAIDRWRISLIRSDPAEEVREFFFPEGAVLPSGGFQILLFIDNDAKPWRAGFHLPAEGATLELRDRFGELVDRVTYPALESENSYARFSDGDLVFRESDTPDPGAPNLDQGPVEPIVDLNGISLTSLAAGGPLRFYATAIDDVAVLGLTLHWRRRGMPATPFEPVLLFDDGRSGDGARLDGVFSGAMGQPLEAGAEIEFYLEAEDVSGARKFAPGNPSGAIDDDVAAELYTLRLPSSTPVGPPLEISEIVSSPPEGIADYAELRNTGTESASLADLEIAESLFGGNQRLKFRASDLVDHPFDSPVLAPHAYRLIICDGSTEGRTAPSLFHAPFRLDADRTGQLFLIGRSAIGSQEILDYAVYPSLRREVAYARLGVGGRFHQMPSTPGSQNVSTGAILPFLDRRPDGTWFELGLPTEAGIPPRLESSPDGRSWTPVDLGFPSDGFEHFIEHPIVDPAWFYRLIK